MCRNWFRRRARRQETGDRRQEETGDRRRQETGGDRGLLHGASIWLERIEGRNKARPSGNKVIFVWEIKKPRHPVGQRGS